MEIYNNKMILKIDNEGIVFTNAANIGTRLTIAAGSVSENGT